MTTRFDKLMEMLKVPKNTYDLVVSVRPRLSLDLVVLGSSKWRKTGRDK